MRKDLRGPARGPKSGEQALPHSAAPLEALNRHRGKGQQKVTVEHVHVHAGGQAVVGTVEAPGGSAEIRGSSPCKANCPCTSARDAAAIRGRDAFARDFRRSGDEDLSGAISWLTFSRAEQLTAAEEETIAPGAPGRTCGKLQDAEWTICPQRKPRTCRCSAQLAGSRGKACSLRPIDTAIWRPAGSQSARMKTIIARPSSAPSLAMR
jgi:hypothetical protein